jgi:hypothetical protein
VKGCPDDKAWAIVSKQGVHRITFSQDLAEHALNSIKDPQYSIQRVRLFLGKELPLGQVSSTGAYAIIDRRKGKTLRVALNQELAEVLCDYSSRYVREVSIKFTAKPEKEE